VPYWHDATVALARQFFRQRPGYSRHRSNYWWLGGTRGRIRQDHRGSNKLAISGDLSAITHASPSTGCEWILWDRKNKGKVVSSRLVSESNWLCSIAHARTHGLMASMHALHLGMCVCVASWANCWPCGVVRSLSLVSARSSSSPLALLACLSWQPCLAAGGVDQRWRTLLLQGWGSPGREAANCFQDLAYHACRFGLFCSLFSAGDTAATTGQWGFYFFFNKKCTGVFRTLDAYMDIIIRVQGSSMSDSTAKSLRLPKYIQHMASYEKKHVNETCKLTNFGYIWWWSLVSRVRDKHQC